MMLSTLKDEVCRDIVAWRSALLISRFIKAGKMTDMFDPENCAIAMTCRLFHEEAMEAYFRNLHVNLKVVCTSDFTGDLSRFGTASFRNRIKSIEIGDCDEARKWRMCAAFKNAYIQLHCKCASGARKGAYYLS